MRLLNRHSSCYLVRSESVELMAAPPGPDLAATTDWIATRAGQQGTIVLSDPRQSDLVLRTEGGSVTLGRLTPATQAAGMWRLVPVADGSTHHHVVSASRPSVGLILGPPVGQHRFHHVKVGPVGSDPATMWHIDSDTCVRDARSLHLRYAAPAEVNIWYNEVAPLDVPIGTFFCTSGFGSNASGAAPSGYAGIQKRADGSRIAIFSVWHRMLDETTPDPNALATVVTAGPRAQKMTFDGEGSGQSLRIPFQWGDHANSFTRFVISARPDGADTVVSAYVSEWGERWEHVGSIQRARTGGRLLTAPYAFVEDFMRNGNEEGVPADRRSPYQAHRACFSNPWTGFVDTGGAKRLEPITSVKVTAYSPHPLESISVVRCGSGSNTFGLLAGTGVETSADSNVLGTTIEDWARSNRATPILPDGIGAI